jgi:phosphoribosylaminoimidazole carboxylase (NCAIR synthetase)
MKKVFVLFGLLFAVCLAVCFTGPLSARAVEQTNQNAPASAQPNTQATLTHPRRRHRRRRIRRAAVNAPDKVVDKSKTVAEKSQDVGENVVSKSKTVGRQGRRVGTRVGRRGKHVTNKVVDKTRDVVKPKQ